MAIQQGLFPFTGRLGNVIGYKRKGKLCFRSMPDHVNQSPATQAASLAFGKASRLGAAMRHALGKLPDGIPTGGTGNRFNTALTAVLQAGSHHRFKRFVPASFRLLKGLELNPLASLSSLLPITPTVVRDYHGNLHVTLPAMAHVTGNPDATHISIKAVALYIDSSFNQAAATASEPVLLPVGDPSPEITLMVPAGKGAVCTLLLEVTGWLKEDRWMVQLHNKKYSAAAVFAVLVKRAARVKRRKRVHIGQQLPPAMPGASIGFNQRE